MTTDAARHRVLEGVLLRLARRPNIGDFVLRGGMLLRHWFRPHPRPADDVDLVATFPFEIEDAARRFLPVLADDVGDGVVFDLDRTRVTGIWLDTGAPGVRVFTAGTVGGQEIDFHADLTFGPPPRPTPVFEAIPTACGETADLWVCRPETVVGQKVQALAHLGVLGWRAKDLDDLHRLLTRVPMEEAALVTAVAAYLGDMGRGAADAKELFGPAAWWGMKRSSARWSDFVRDSPGRDVPPDLAAVIAEIARRLAPVLEGLS